MAKPTANSRKLTDFTPDLKNANKHTLRGIAMLEDSLQELGAGRSIVVDKHNNVIAGNATLETAVQAGFEDAIVVPTDGSQLVVVQRVDLDLDSPRGRKLALADNRVSEVDMSWDADVLKSLQDDGVDLSKLWDEDELAELLASVNGDEPKPDPGAQTDRAAELQAKWNTADGQVWQLGKHRLAVGDCTKPAIIEQLMQGQRAALAWFDPPFGIELQPQRGLTDAIHNDGNAEARQLWADFLPLMNDALSDDSHAFICQDWTEFDWSLPLLKEYFTLKSKVVWFKNVWGIGYYTRPQHEDVIYCWKGKPETPAEPVSDVWQVAREPAPEHAAEKPAELSRIAIEHFTKRDAIVIDWFAGKGGSLVACEQTGRVWRGIEIDPKWCAVIIQRWVDVTGRDAVLYDA